VAIVRSFFRPCVDLRGGGYAYNIKNEFFNAFERLPKQNKLVAGSYNITK